MFIKVLLRFIVNPYISTHLLMKSCQANNKKHALKNMSNNIFRSFNLPKLQNFIQS